MTPTLWSPSSTSWTESAASRTPKIFSVTRIRLGFKWSLTRLAQRNTTTSMYARPLIASAEGWISGPSSGVGNARAREPVSPEVGRRVELLECFAGRGRHGCFPLAQLVVERRRRFAGGLSHINHARCRKVITPRSVCACWTAR
jgi:hypothetical protein